MIWQHVLCYLATGLLQNVAVVVMGWRMPNYPMFALYGTTFIYAVIFGLIARARQERFTFSREETRLVLWLGVWTSLNGVFAQFAVPKLDGDLQTLISQVSIPTTWAVGWLMFRTRLHRNQKLAILALFVGLVVALLPPVVLQQHTGNHQDSPFWMLICLLSAFPTALETTFQEKIFKQHDAPLFATLFWYNTFSLVVFCACIFLTMTETFGSGYTWDEMWYNQVLALQCFFNDHSAVPGCYPGATFWILAFTFGYVGYFASGAVILKERSSIFESNLNAVLVPLTAVAFWFPWLVGEGQADKPTWFTAVGAVLICIGIVLWNLVPLSWKEESRPIVDNNGTITA